MPFLKNNSYSAGFILLLINSMFISKCTSSLTKKHEFSYKISEPATKYVLQHNLREVSGLSFISDDEVALIEDENGAIFFFNLSEGKITRKILFAKDGDYEDLKIVGDTAFIIRSDGKLFEIINLKGPNAEIIENKYNTGLSKENNTEGLCYDDEQKLILIACKDSPGKNEKFKNKKAIYSFNPETKLLSEAPIFLIDVNEVEKIAYSTENNFIQKLMRFYRNSKRATFKPSALSIHPFTRELYVLSSVGKLLVVIDRNGKIEHVIKLPPAIFKQPEGIAFDSSGNMYISNEGRNGKANILKYLYQKN